MDIKFTEYCNSCDFYNYRHYTRKTENWASRQIGTNGKPCQNCDNRGTWRMEYKEIPTSPRDELKVTKDKIKTTTEQLDGINSMLKNCIK